VLITALGRRVEDPVDGTLPPALSGPEDSPEVLDNIRLWTAIAVVLVLLAYSLPIASIVRDGGLFGLGGEAFPVSVDLSTLLEVLR